MKEIPEIKPGDLVKVSTKIVEGGKERITPFQGIVIQTKGSGIGKTVTIRKISAGIGIERIFPIRSPLITKIEIKKRGKVRRAKLNYLRYKKGRKMKIKEREEKAPAKTTPIEETPVKQEDKSIEGSAGQKPVEKT